MDKKKIQLLKAIRQDIVDAKIQHVQLLLRKHGNKLALVFTSIDNDTYKAKVRDITDRYCESLSLVSETKTTQTYLS